MRSIPRRAIHATFLLPLLLVSTVGHAQDGDVEKKTRAVLDRYAERSLSQAWEGSRALEALGDETIPWLRQALASESTTRQLMAAKTLIALGEPSEVDRTLVRIAQDPDLQADHRAAAIRLLSDYSTPTVEKALRELITTEAKGDALLRVATATALYEVCRDRELTRDALMPLLDVDNAEARDGAALALARMGLFDGKVKRVLRALELEPSLRGDQARLLLDQDRMLRSLERAVDAAPAPTSVVAEELQQKILVLERELELQTDRLQRAERGGSGRTGIPLIDELLDRVEYFYAEPDRVERNTLVTEAAKGLVGSLDPFSSFMDVKDTKEFYEGITGEYAGIGAQVGKDPDTDFLKILRPIYKGPAYEMGLLTDDLLTTVEGQTTKGMRLDEIVKILKGVPGTPVKVEVLRRGWKEPREYAITRRLIQLDSVRSTMLPADIGYISLAQFGETAVEEVETALDELAAQGMRGLILDLRYNPGGYLQAAVDLVDNFVSDTERPIVTQRAPSGRFGVQSKSATAEVRGDWPLVVLVNDSSASASEIVSGALQDFERATIVGERTYGKGSVQRLLPMSDRINEMLGGETTLRLTVQYYYLPSGRSIHAKRAIDGTVIEEGGVEPDVVIEPETMELWRLQSLDELAEQGVFDEYLDKYFDEHHDDFARIAREGDAGATAEYPDFDAFFTPRNSSNAQVDDIRYQLRAKIRRRIEDERGKQFACDFSEDRQLQRAIVELLRKLELPAQTVPQYEMFARKFTEEKQL